MNINDRLTKLFLDLIEDKMVTMKIDTLSMHPFMPIYEKVGIEKIEFSSINIGDVVLFYCKEQLIIHRVIAKRLGYFIAKGDHNNSLGECDLKVKESDVIGRVKFITREGVTVNTSHFLYRIFAYFLAKFQFFIVITMEKHEKFMILRIFKRVFIQVFKFANRCLFFVLGGRAKLSS